MPVFRNYTVRNMYGIWTGHPATHNDAREAATRVIRYGIGCSQPKVAPPRDGKVVYNTPVFRNH